MKTKKLHLRSDSIYIALYLFIRIVVANLIKKDAIGDESAYLGIMHVIESVMFLLITLCLKHQLSTGVLEPGIFPIYFLLVSGSYLFIECAVSFDRDIIALIIYSASMIMLYRMENKKIVNFSRQDWLNLGVATLQTLAFYFLIFAPLFYQYLDTNRWFVVILDKYFPFYWIERATAHFSHGAMLEEPMFRLFLLNKLKEYRVQPWLAIVLQSFLFSVAHIGRGNFGVLVATFSLAIIFGVSSWYSRKINAAIISHTIYNVLQESVGMFLVYWN